MCIPGRISSATVSTPTVKHAVSRHVAALRDEGEIGRQVPETLVTSVGRRIILVVFVEMAP